MADIHYLTRRTDQLAAGKGHMASRPYKHGWSNCRVLE